MSIFKTNLSTGLALLSGLVLAATLSVSHAQDEPPVDDSGIQLAKFGGAMHFTASTCGGYSEKQLEELKSQQQDMLEKNGVDEHSFDQAYMAGMREAEVRWESLSQEEQKKACAEIQDKSNEMSE